MKALTLVMIHVICASGHSTANSSLFCILLAGMSVSWFYVLRLRIKLTVMVKNYIWLVTALAVACFAPGVAAQVSSGTAFAVARGLLITNQHVIAGCRSVDVIAADSRRSGSIVEADDQIDLALLRVSGITGATARLRSPRTVRLGEPVMVFGFPLTGSLSSSGNFTAGLVSALRGLNDAAGELQITAPVQPGNSGGPLMDANGLVIGVVQAKLDAIRAAMATGDIPQNVNFAISLDVLAKFLAKNRVAFRDGAISAPLDTARVAELAQSFTYRVECQRRFKSQEPEVMRGGSKSQQPEVVKREPKSQGPEVVREDVIKKIRETRAEAEKLMARHEAERVRLLKHYEQTREQYYLGLVRRNEVLKAEQALAEAMLRVDEDKRWLAEADLAIKEYSEKDKLLRNQPSR
jgi:Trypsin-like peptidase domain